MLVSDKYNFIHLAIPRTGCTSMIRFLRKHYGARSVGSYHGNFIENPKNYTVWTVVRNPWTRLVSWWWFSCRMGRSGQPKREWDLFSLLDLAEFIDWVVARRGVKCMQKGHEVQRESMTTFCEPMNPRWIKLEQLAVQFPSLPFVGLGMNKIGLIEKVSFSDREVLAPSWKAEREHVADWYDDRAIEAAKRHGVLDDCAKFHYSTDPGDAA